MFDYIRSEIPLPDGFEGELQTKDFNCEMGTHVIRADGRLILAILDHTEEVPVKERPYPNGEGLLKFVGSVRCIWRYEDANYHGMVNFYGSEFTLPDGARWSGPVIFQNGKRHTPGGVEIADKWHEYVAKFTDGQLVRIEAEEDRS